MPGQPPRSDRKDQPEFFDDEARIVEQFQRHERPEVVDAEIEEDPEPVEEAAAEEPATEEPAPPDEAPPAEEPPAVAQAAPEQTETQRTDAKRYERIHHWLFAADIAGTVLALALFLFLGGSTHLRVFIENRLSANPFAAAAFYGMIVTLLYYFVVLIPLHYADYFFEQRFELSRQSFFSWFLDEFKSLGLNMVLVVAFLQIAYLLLRATPHYWWLWAALACTALGVVLTKLTPVLLIPIFYKREPLDDDELAERLRHLVERVRMSVVAVEKLGLGAKTVKANAMLAGLGNTKRVLLGDTLIEHFTQDEIETVLAHELGHHYHNHIWKLIGAGAVITFAAFLIANTVLHSLVGAFGFLNFRGVADVAAFPILAFALFVVTLVAMPISNTLSRILERQADRFALRLTRNPAAFISAMRRLAVQNLADTEPSPVVEFLFHGHPSISRRIAAAEAFQDEES